MGERGTCTIASFERDPRNDVSPIAKKHPRSPNGSQDSSDLPKSQRLEDPGEGGEFVPPMIDLTVDPNVPETRYSGISDPSALHEFQWWESVESRLHELHDNEQFFASEEQVSALLSNYVLRENLETTLATFISQMSKAKKECLDNHAHHTTQLSGFERLFKTEIAKLQREFSKFSEDHKLGIASSVTLIHDQVISDFEAMFQKVHAEFENKWAMWEKRAQTISESTPMCQDPEIPAFMKAKLDEFNQNVHQVRVELLERLHKDLTSGLQDVCGKIRLVARNTVSRDSYQNHLMQVVSKVNDLENQVGNLRKSISEKDLQNQRLSHENQELRGLFEKMNLEWGAKFSMLQVRFESISAPLLSRPATGNVISAFTGDRGTPAASINAPLNSFSAPGLR